MAGWHRGKPIDWELELMGIGCGALLALVGLGTLWMFVRIGQYWWVKLFGG